MAAHQAPGKNTAVSCHFLLQCMKVKSESEVAQSCPTLRDPMDCSLPGSSVHGISQARVLEWGAIAFSVVYAYPTHLSHEFASHCPLTFCMNFTLEASVSLSSKPKTISNFISIKVMPCNSRILLAEKAHFKVPERVMKMQFINDWHFSYLEIAVFKKVLPHAFMTSFALYIKKNAISIKKVFLYEPFLHLYKGENQQCLKEVKSSND